ncbi:tagaturonate reductase [Paenibacillus donghaensis]|uniref:Altronate oxidoreductase n=1 Tax=Paenibacillus donghaensis TaxID=414771 RepID=A0A2Z2KG31_9BACL|nr:tagaturonate reductase [Paenibacillus donghaensis]ASA25124.1 altronate oxidoreductase [Paenibacillus donghaensis]
MDQLNRKTWKSYKQYPEKVLQFGEGNFMRAFVDWQIHAMNQQAGFDGSVVVVQPLANGLSQMLNDQDGLYTLYLQGIKDGEAVKEHEVINCISRTLNPYAEHDEYMKLAENPQLRFIVSNTTEAGIAFEPGDKLTDAPQQSFPGKLTALLYRRYELFQGEASKGFIIIPCELIDRNGDELKKVVLQYAELWNLGEGFISWLNEANTFCCSLVDRIVPGYPRDSIAEITEELGYKDNLVVVGEQFHLWVIEGPQWIKDEFPAHLAGLNVLVVDDMTPYRTRKVRILNGAHTALTPVAYLYGVDTVAEAVEHEVVGPFVKSLIYEEIIPTLDLPVEELKSFADAVLERFLNPYVQHYVLSISLNSISKFKTRDLPSLLEYAESTGKLPEKLVFSLSALICFYKGQRGEESIPLADDADILEWFASLWSGWDGTEAGLRALVTEVLAAQNRWGRDLNEVFGLTDKVAEGLIAIQGKGMQQALQDLLNQPAHN